MAKETVGEPLISVIIPVYNVEKYIDRCMKSVLNQTYRNLEIILVDDGSTDSSGEKCDQYAERDERVMVIHKRNGGLSDARNAALDVITGNWVTFIDSDDWVHKDYIMEMVNIAIKENVSTVSLSFLKTDKMTVDDTGQNHKGQKVYIFSKEEGIQNLLYQKYLSSAAWGKLFKATLWGNNRFPYGVLYEDVETVYRIYTLCTKSAYTDKKYYYYYSRSNSIVSEKFSIKKMDYVVNCQSLLQSVKQEFPGFEKAAYSRLLWSEIHVLVHMDDCDKYHEQHDAMWSDIKRNRKKVIFDIRSRFINKIVLILSFGGDRLLKKVFGLRRRM